MSSIKGLIFDLDYTLYDEGDYLRAAIDAFCQKYNFISADFLPFLTYEYRIQSGDILRDILLHADHFNATYHDELFEWYKSVNARLKLYDGAMDFLKYAKKNDIKTAIITNGNVDAQANKIRCLGLQKIIDVIILARELGAEYDKPHPLPFLTCLHKMGLSPREVFYIGDNPLVDMVGAGKLKIPGILITHNNFKVTKINCPAQYVVNSFDELKIYLFSDK